MTGSRAGFSLIEVLVAVMVFAVAGAIATGMLHASLTSRDHVLASQERAEMIDRARLLMREDIGQLVNRPGRHPDGRRGEISFAGSTSGLSASSPSAGERVLMAFTRSGRPNPGRLQPRGSLQYVEYVRSGDRLIRRSWAYPDRQIDTPAQEFVLLAGVEDIELSFLGPTGWVTTILAARDAGASSALPRAIRVRAATIESLEFLFLTPEFPS